MAAIDFESAGVLPGFTDIPIQVGIAELERASRIESSRFYRSFLAADREVAMSAWKVHGISRADLIGAPRLLDLWPELRDRLAGRLVVAHAAATEKRFLRAFPSHGFGPWVDTLTLAKRCLPSASSYALGDLVEALGLGSRLQTLCPGLRWHDALYDAVGSLLLLKEIIEKCHLAHRPVRDLL
jgi:DNA polymerase-3 subunit epsilon